MTRKLPEAPQEDPVRSEDGHVERFDPVADRGRLMAAEHYLRYLWARPLAAGRDVLDAGCGTGYGCGLLRSAGARRVVGVDRSADAVARARDEIPGCEFEVADVSRLPFRDDEFELVTCFEVIEHVDRVSDVVAELARVAGPSGVVAVSTPNRATHPAGNPFHRSELLPEELSAHLGEAFLHVALYRQDAALASLIGPHGAGEEADVAREADVRTHLGFAPGAGDTAYAVVVASNGPLPALRSRAVLGDAFEARWWHQREADLVAALDHERDERLRLELETGRARTSALRELAEANERARAAGASLLQLEARRAEELEAVRATEDLRAQLAAANEAIHAVHRSRLWRVGSAWWRVRDAVLRRDRARR